VTIGLQYLEVGPAMFLPGRGSKSREQRYVPDTRAMRKVKQPAVVLFTWR
jgi:hypothetical protein